MASKLFTNIRLHQWLSLLFAVSLTISFTGCDQSPPPTGEAATKGKEVASHSEEAEDGDTAEPTEEGAYEEIEIETIDGIKLYGRLYDRSQEEDAPPETKEKKYPLIIMLHQLNGTSRDWKKFPQELVKNDYAVFAYDQRGMGRSNQTKRGKTISWRTFKEKDWQKLPTDISRVIGYFEENQADYPQVDTSRIVLIGASIGANASVIGAVRNSDKVKAVVLLSPGEAYKGLRTVEPMVEMKAPVFFAASQEDPESFEATEMLYRISVGKKSIRLFKNVGHGTDMLAAYPALSKDIIEWLAKVGIPNKPATANTAEDAANGSGEHSVDTVSDNLPKSDPH